MVEDEPKVIFCIILSSLLFRALCLRYGELVSNCRLITLFNSSGKLPTFEDSDGMQYSELKSSCTTGKSGISEHIWRR